MSVIWSGVTEEGAVVPVQVDSTGKVIATASIPDEYVLRSGDTMTGPLSLPGDPTNSLQAATKQYVDNTAAVGGQLLAAGLTGSSGLGLIYGINVSSIRKGGEGEYQVYFQTPPSSTNYVVLAAPTNRNRIFRVTSLTALSFNIDFSSTTDGSPDTNFGFAVFGPFPDLRIAYS